MPRKAFRKFIPNIPNNASGSSMPFPNLGASQMSLAVMRRMKEEVVFVIRVIVAGGWFADESVEEEKMMMGLRKRKRSAIFGSSM
ncbi:Hypothetical predicted protein [Prunus dulcis]|uniref:Uncharacterized protein n=1 Tax=Prunus dulcis TaxID=3755 RepID=A0A5E4EE66_PRUDU|nr:Hypothetical predicted protein [Prunus dulcis]